MSWRRFDLNVKGVEGIQERTIGGGVVTLVSCVVVAFLLLSEFSVWWTVSITHRMHVDTAPVSPIHHYFTYFGDNTRPDAVFIVWEAAGLPYQHRGGRFVPP